MDLLTTILSRNQGGSPGGSGRTETKKLTFDGDRTNEIDLLDLKAVKISNDYFDFRTAKSIKIKVVQIASNDEVTEEVVQTLTPSEFMVNSDGVADAIQMIDGNDVLFVCLSEDSEYFGAEKGVYVIVTERDIIVVYAAEALFETIHPIDPKYIPGAVLPVVELTTTIKKGAILTEEESAILTELCADLVPVAINCTIECDGTLYRGRMVFNALVAEIEGVSVMLLSSSLNGLFISLVNVSGANWQCELGQALMEG